MLDNIFEQQRVQTWLGYHIWTLRTHSKDSQIHLFITFPMTCHSHFIFMSDEIILFQFLYRPLKYLLFSLMKMRLIKFIQCGPCFIWFFEKNYITIVYLVLVTFIHFIHITHKVFVVQHLGQNKLFKHSLWILEFFSSHETMS